MMPGKGKVTKRVGGRGNAKRYAEKDVAGVRKRVRNARRGGWNRRWGEEPSFCLKATTEILRYQEKKKHTYSGEAGATEDPSDHREGRGRAENKDRKRGLQRELISLLEGG